MPLLQLDLKNTIWLKFRLLLHTSSETEAALQNVQDRAILTFHNFSAEAQCTKDTHTKIITLQKWRI